MQNIKKIKEQKSSTTQFKITYEGTRRTAHQDLKDEVLAGREEAGARGSKE